MELKRDMPSAPSSLRPVVAADLSELAEVIGATDLFPPELLAGMAAAYLAGEADEIWVRAGPALAYAAPERMTAGCWNLLLIAVHPAAQRSGIGAALVRAVEREALARGARILLVETSGLAAFDGTRTFYRCCGYAEEARIRDFYLDGEDKVVFRKRLSPG